MDNQPNSKAETIVFNEELQSSDCFKGTEKREKNIWLEYFIKEEQKVERLSAEIERLNKVIDLLVRGYNHEISKATIQ